MSNSEDLATRRAAALAVGLGAFGVVVTSAFYALSPPQAALPHPLVSPDAIQATLSGTTTMRIAGVIGMQADVLLAVGAWLVAVRLAARGFGFAALGWAGIALCGALFVVVDALVSTVLPALAAHGTPAYLGFRTLFDALFVIGTWLGGVSALLVLSAPGGVDVPIAPALRVFGTSVALVAIVSAMLYFFGIDSAQGLGLGIAGTSVTLTWLAARSYAGAQVPALCPGTGSSNSLLRG